MADAAHYRALLFPLVAGRPWIVAKDVLVACAREAETLAELGASGVFCLGGSRGTGELPDPARFPQAQLGIAGASIMGSIRAVEAAFAALPPAITARLDAFDPARRARVVASMFSAGMPLAGRPVYGARPAAWQALEDKTVCDELWDASGVRRASSEIVPATASALRRAADRLDAGLGTVWAGDNREGFHGGAEFLRWVRNEAQAAEAADFLAAHGNRARVMPFLDGLPCSIHALVLADAVIAFRPCELVVFRVPGSTRLEYAGSATFWDPLPTDREEMRRIARAVGRHLRERVGYRGVCTVDGVMTRGGFRPTELNPRFGAALSILAAGLPDLPLYLLHLAAAAGEDLDWRAEELEELVVASADLNRRGGGMRVLARRVEENQSLALVAAGEGWRAAGEGEEADAELTLGPGPLGGFLRVTLSPGRTPIGSSVAPRVAAAMRFAAARWDLDIPPLEAAPEVRGG
ncbi:MAG: hypothetical protein AB1726_04525 [Planctomycetota bacterium]